MVEFLKKFENRGIKIARVNSIPITKSNNLPLFTLILQCWALWIDNRGAYYWSHSFAKQHIDNRILHCL